MRMKMRNKKTGDEVEFGYLQTDYIAPLVLTYHKDGKPTMVKYNSLAEFNEEWEDCEKPKEYWWIDYDGEVKSFIDLYEWQDKMKEIGNYFETREEAEKAVEKLKAFKRLKDKGFRFTEWYPVDEGLPNLKIDANINILNKNIDNGDIDLNLLFGGEE